MRHLVIDRQIAGIIKWLERLKKSYSSGAMESALMEAECARADLEYLRQDVWDRVKPGSLRRNKVLSALITISRPAFLALLIILLAVVPLSREVPAPAVKYDRSKIVLAEPVLIIREDKSGETVIDMKSPPVSSVTPADSAPAASANSVPAPPAVNVKSRKTAGNIKRVQTQTQAAGIAPVKPEIKAASPIQKAEKAKLLPYDQVISLMQTGQKALKNNSSVIKIKD